MPATGDSACVQRWTHPYKDLSILEFDWIADSGDGSFVPVTTVSIEGWAFMGITVPGVSPAVVPTDQYDITLLDADGVDIFGGELTNRSSTLKEQAVPKIGSVWGKRRVTGVLELVIINNSAHGASGKLKVYFATALRRV
jgi:hypothetical protein